MNVLFLYHSLRANGINFLRSRYFVEDLEQHGHNVRLAYFIAEDKEMWEKLQDDVISFDEVSEFHPDVLIFELGSANRFPSREWLDELKYKGCIIVHCGLDYNNYDQNRKLYDEMYAGFGYEILKKIDDMEGTGELPIIQGSGRSHTSRTNIETLKKHCAIRDPMIFQNVPWVESHSALIIKLGYNTLLTSGPNSFVKAYNDWDIHGENNAVYGAFSDKNGGIEILITGHFVTDGNVKTEREHNRTFLLNVLEYFHSFHPLKYKRFSIEESHQRKIYRGVTKPKPSGVSIENLNQKEMEGSLYKYDIIKEEIIPGSLEDFRALMHEIYQLQPSFAEDSIFLQGERTPSDYPENMGRWEVTLGGTLNKRGFILARQLPNGTTKLQFAYYSKFDPIGSQFDVHLVNQILKWDILQVEAKLTRENRRIFHQNLINHFNTEELRTVAFEMEIQHENFSGKLDSFARELIEYCERHQLFEELKKICQKNRPNTTW